MLVIIDYGSINACKSFVIFMVESYWIPHTCRQGIFQGNKCFLLGVSHVPYFWLNLRESIPLFMLLTN